MNTITLGDSLEVMKEMRDNSVDLVITDPPVGEIVDLRPYIDEIIRVSKDQIIFGMERLCGALPPSDTFIVVIEYDMNRLAWKHQDRGRSFIVDVSCARMMSDETSFYSRRLNSHAVDDLINRYTEQGDVVFDPFCGSGTVVRSAQKTGRRFIGIDLRRECYEASIKLVNNGDS